MRSFSFAECKAVQDFPVRYFSLLDSDHAAGGVCVCVLIFHTSRTYSVCSRQYPDVIRPEVPVSCEHRELEIITRTAEQ